MIRTIRCPICNRRSGVVRVPFERNVFNCERCSYLRFTDERGTPKQPKPGIGLRTAVKA